MYTVYRLENIVTKKNYIGMTSQKPNERWCSGYRGKMKEAIATYPLDLCWKKHIEFQTTNKEQALELEAELMKWYDSVENGYNSSTYSSYGFTEETKKKISESLSGRLLSEEHRKHISEATTGENNPFYGKHHSEETRNKISEAKIGKHLTEESRKKISEATTGENNPMFGKHHSEETKKKLSEANKGKINAPTKSVIQYSKDGEFIAEYSSIHEAERRVGCDKSIICKCCKGKRKSACGYIWKYKE